MHLGLKSIHFNIRESIFLKIWIHFNSFQSILVCWVITFKHNVINIIYNTICKSYILSSKRKWIEMNWNWIQIFRNIDSQMLKWIHFNPKCIFLFIYRNYGGIMEHISMPFNLKIILAFSVHYEYCSIQNFE